MRRLAIVGVLLASLSHCASRETIGRPRVRIITTGIAGDGSLGDLASSGVLQARGGFGADFDLEFLGLSPNDARTTLQGWVAEASERDLLIFTGFVFEPIVRELQCDFGGASVLLTGTESETCLNLRSVSYQLFEPSYLAGVVAVSDPSLTPTGRVGIIGGADVIQVREVIGPFQQGVEARGGTVVDIAYVGDDESGFFDPVRAAEVARDMAPNVDIILSVAGPSGVGVGQALDELGEGERTYLIGVETDFSTRFASITLASILRRVDISVRDAILEFVGGELGSGNLQVGFRDRHTELVLSPTYGSRPIDGGCQECDPYDTPCLSSCETLTDLVEAAIQEALEARRAAQ